MKSVYAGGEKVGEFESYDELRVGDGKPAFIYEGSELVYPNPVKDGLVLWYDFSGMTNEDISRGIAKDLSGNGNHGTLQNFNFTEESGYEGSKLKFDGVDDKIEVEMLLPALCTYEATFIKTSDFGWKSPMSSLQLTTVGDTGFSMTPRSNGITISAGDGIDRYTHLYFYTSPIPKNELTHLVTTYDGTSFSVYINGVLIGSQPFNLVQSDYINLGNWSRYTSLGYWYDWETHSAKVYNRPLTPEEIAHNYAIEKERFNIQEV